MSAHRLLTGFAILAALSAIFPTPLAAASDDAVIVLPPFEVRGLRPWLLFRFGTYEVLSLKSERDSTRIAERLWYASRFAEPFLPPSLLKELPAHTTIFIDHDEGNAAIRMIRDNLQVPMTLGAIHLASHGRLVQLPGFGTADQIRRGTYNPLILILNGLDNVADTPFPAWYSDAYTQMLGGGRLSERELMLRSWPFEERYFGALDRLFSVRTSDESVSIRQGAGGAIEVASRMGLALGSPEFRELRQKLNDEKIQYLTTAEAFLRWAMFADEGSHRLAMLEFVDDARERPVDEELFRRHFGLSYSEATRAIVRFANGSERRRDRLQASGDSSRVASRSPDPKPASLDDLARLAGEFYIMIADASFRGEPDDATDDHAVRIDSTDRISQALAVQREAYWRLARTLLEETLRTGSRDPEVLAQLGILDFSQDRLEEARLHLVQAAEGGTSNAYAIQLLAQIKPADLESIGGVN